MPRGRERISIHAPRKGSDQVVEAHPDLDYTFQSTLPVRGATCRCRRGSHIGEISIHAPRKGSDHEYEEIKKNFYEQISIHAPRKGSDFPAPKPPAAPHNFNPRSP